MAGLEVGCIPLGMYMTNCYFIFDKETKNTLVIDPADSGDYIFGELTKKGLSVKAILLTHGHFDHIYGVKELKEKAGVLVYSHENEKNLLSNPDINCSKSFGRLAIVTPDVFLKDGEETDIAGITFKTIFTPGHTEGSTCFYFENEGILFSGDTLFCDSVGRTDLPTGSMSTLVRSIKEKLMILPDEVRVFPGHGESTSIGHERDYNPFL